MISNRAGSEAAPSACRLVVGAIMRAYVIVATMSNTGSIFFPAASFHDRLPPPPRSRRGQGQQESARVIGAQTGLWSICYFLLARRLTALIDQVSSTPRPVCEVVTGSAAMDVAQIAALLLFLLTLLATLTAFQF